MSQTPPPPPLRRTAPPPGGQPPYGAPYGAPPYRPRPAEAPRALWFVIGGVLLVLAPIIFVGALFTVLRPLTQEDAVFAADGQAGAGHLPAGEERALFIEDGCAGQCNATDGSRRSTSTSGR